MLTLPVRVDLMVLLRVVWRSDKFSPFQRLRRWRHHFSISYLSRVLLPRALLLAHPVFWARAAPTARDPRNSSVLVSVHEHHVVI